MPEDFSGKNAVMKMGKTSMVIALVVRTGDCFDYFMI
jgi:hypothetical protein